ncbi:nicotinate-nucleotide adenylyltransferase [Geobacter sp. DSM 9736]|uniref:nicotinate-nucleotide adenylyltransferase n=1 Tax=Geobacter sp. DSM 9736 TaxID=1277350 RepID=UPI000B50B180|nr:nicotinate-nucleotide adenylyltransferase [Geobacter sp. DSM 9736]SNB47856.1 nicotinate-nucleotide adenylyltransferase [Geobacter sp. DSM 9736]
MKIGIIGGTFNPVHNAHLRIAEEVRDWFGLDRVIFIPAAVPPHKPIYGDLPFIHRYEMVRLAIAANPHFTVSDMEQQRGGTSYSIDTLRALRRAYQNDSLYFVIGSDSFLEIGSWREYQGIFGCCNIIVVERPGAAVTDPHKALPVAVAGEFSYLEAERQLSHCSGNSVYFRTGAPLDISSSAIRELASRGRSIRYLVPDAVEHYIKEKRLYAHA